jgi:Tol biopolymer transport system component
MSGDGRFIAFESRAWNLVVGDTNGETDIFVRDVVTGATTRVSIGPAGVQSNDESFFPTISGDGRYVAFESLATNLVVGDTNAKQDVFVHDRHTGTTSLVSRHTTGAIANSHCWGQKISADGRFVAFTSQASNLVDDDFNNRLDVFVRDLLDETAARVSVSGAGIEANGDSNSPSLSANGRFIAFHSRATNLVPGDSNFKGDVFVFDLQTSSIIRASVGQAGVEANDESGAPSISYDGNSIAFQSIATNLVAGDTNGVSDVFLRRLNTGTTSRVSLGLQGSQANDVSGLPVISGDGTSVAFFSYATNVVAGDTNARPDVFLFDINSSSTFLASCSTSGQFSNEGATAPFIGFTGSSVGFSSISDNLVPNDPAECDIFVRYISPNSIQPNNLSIVRGIVEQGNVSSLISSDDLRLIMRPGPVFVSSQPPIEIVVTGQSSVSDPLVLCFAVEAGTTSPAIVQRVELYDFEHQQFRLLSTESSTIPDSEVYITPLIARHFVGPGLEVRARISYRAEGPVFSYPWRARLDRVRWLVN